MSVPALPFGCATSVTACVMVLTLLRSPSGPAATVAAATPTKRRRSKSGGFDIPCLLTSFRSTSPSSARRWTPRQDPARYHDPHQAHDGPDEPRRGAVRCPESAAHPRGAAQYAEHDDCDPRPEEGVRDQPGPPEPERPCHDQHRARKRTQQDEDPREVIQSRCERLISGAGDRVREGCAYREEYEKQSADRCARGGRCRAPAVLPRIRQGGPERRREPHEVEDIQAGERRSDQDPRAMAAVERRECVGRCADLRLIAVDDVRDDDEDDEVDAAQAPQAFPERAGGVHAGG